MKQTKSLLTLFLTAALAVANIAPSWGATYPEPSDALPTTGNSGKYFIESVLNVGSFVVPGSTTMTTTCNAAIPWMVTNQEGNYMISGVSNNITYYLSYAGDPASGTAIKPTITDAPQVVALFKPTKFLDPNSTTTAVKDFLNYEYKDSCKTITPPSAPSATTWRGFSASSATNTTTLTLKELNTSKTNSIKFVWAFHQAKYFTATANANDNNGGQVYASLTDDFTTNTVSGCVPSDTTNVNFKAVKADGYNFAGWFTNPTCTNPVKDGLIDCSYTDEQITVTVSSTSTTESAPTITTLYAKFSSDTQKLDFAYTWNCGDVIYGDEAYSNLITVLGENTPSYTLTVVDGAEYLNVDNEDNVTSFETKDYVGADQTITFHIYSEGNDTYKGIDEDISVTLRTAPNHLPIFVTSNSQYDLVTKATDGTISCDSKGEITVTRNYSKNRNITFAWHGEAKQALFDYRAVRELGITGTCTITFTWLDKASNSLGSSTLGVPVTKVDDSKHILNAPAGARQLQMTFSGNVTVVLSKVAFTENNPATYNVQYLVPESHGTATGISTTEYTFEFGGEPVLTHPYDYVILSANPETGYYVREWYYLDKDNKRHPLSKMLQQSYEGIIPSDAVKVSAEFSDTCFVVDDTQMFTNLSAALAATHSGSIVRLLRDYTVPAGNYTIPAGVTLLVPNKEDQTTPVGMNVRLLMPEKSGSTWISPAILNDKYAYRTLTLASGANITVNGAIEVTGDQYAEAGVLHQLNGIVAGPYGQIVLNSGSKITLNSNSTLRAWGYITGAGTIDAKNGSIVREFFQIADWRGGDVVLDMLADKKAFPTTQYYIQNIESAVTYYTGAQLITKACVFVPTFEMLVAADDIIIIGIEGTGSPMFYMQPLSDANTWVRKSYDAVNDRQVYTLNSSASLGSMHINIKASEFSADMNSKDFVLPITNNMDIILNDGTMNITQSTVLLPGATIQNSKTSTVIVQETSESSTGSVSCALYLTDVDEYAALGVGGRTDTNNEYIIPVFYSPSWTNGCPRTDAQYDKTKLADAELFIHGSLDLEGSLYTTDGGANIHSTSADAGTIRFFNDAAAGSVPLYQKTATYKENNVTAAKLRNDNGTTVSTQGTKAKQSYNFYEGAWRCWETEGCLEVDKTDQTDQSKWVYYAKPQDYVALTSGAEDADHLYHSVEGSRTLILTTDDGGNCQWWEVTKVPNEDYYFCATNGIYYYYDVESEAWLEKTAQVTFVNSDGTVLKEYEDAIIGTTVTLPDNPSHPTDPSNYDFAGWSPEPGVITGDITFTALYTQHGVTIEDKELATNKEWEVPAGTVVADLTLNASADASCQIKNIQNLIVKGNVYLDYTFNAQAFTQAGQQWYAFGVPFQVNANTGMSLTLGSQIDIIYYDGATRATNGKNGSAWKYVDAQPSANRILRPGVLYLAAFRNATTTVRFTKDANAQLNNAEGVASVSSYASLTADPQDRGWNGIANPALFYATLDAGVTTGQVYQNGNNSYLAVDMTSKPFVIGAPVFVQVDATKSVVVNSIAAAAPVRKLMTKTSSNYSVALSQNGKLSDRVIVAIDDYATDEYTIGQDLAKAGVSTKVAQMWVERYEAQLCKNTVAADNNMAEYPLTIFAPKAGEYTIALEQTPTDAILFLTENGSITWNLNIAPATLDLSKGTDTTYGLRLVRKSGDVVTGNNEVILNGDVQKVIINDRLYIIRDGKVYSAHGHVIK